MDLSKVPSPVRLTAASPGSLLGDGRSVLPGSVNAKCHQAKDIMTVMNELKLERSLGPSEQDG